MKILAPRPGFQLRAATTKADHALVGGIAGPGKTFILCFNAAFDASGSVISYRLNEKTGQYEAFGQLYERLLDKGQCDKNGVVYCYKIPKYRAAIFRRERTHMDDLIDQCAEIFIPLGAKWSGNPNFYFAFPSGARIHLDHMQNLGDWVKHRGNARHYLGFDEICEFYEQQIFGILPWNRSTEPALRPRLQGSCNFEGVGVDWVKKYWKIQCECPEHGGHNELFYETVKLEDGSESRISKEFVFGDRKGSYLEEFSPNYIQNLIVQLGGVKSPRYKALGLGCCEVSKGSFFPEVDEQVHLVPDNWLPARFNWVNVSGYDFASSAEGDAAAFVNILVNENRDVIIDDIWLGWGKSVIEQSEEFRPMYSASSIHFSGRDLFASNRAAGDIKTIADQFREEPKRAGAEPMVFIKCEPDNKTAASLIRSALKATIDGRNGALFVRNRCRRIFDDMKALLCDADDFDQWIEQRLTIEHKGQKRQYHFDAFHAFKHAICGAYHTEQLPQQQPKQSERRERTLEKIREREAVEPCNCTYSLE